MISEYPNEIVEAKITIEQFTASTLLEKIESAPMINSAVVKLHNYIQESINSSNSKRISTFLQTHTRKLLEFLEELKNFGPNMKDWISIRFTLLLLEREVREEVNRNQKLEREYTKFVLLYSESVRTSVKKDIEKGEKTKWNDVLLKMCEP